VQVDDLEAFFAHQTDPEACRVASFEGRERDAFFTHWARLMSDPSLVLRAVICEGQLAGNVVSWPTDAQTTRGEEARLVGYWLGREFWGRGIATLALKAFVPLLTLPVHAHVAASNPASIRVLEKAGFRRVGERDDLIYRLGD
jgi:RimJ/RimL family protein N-acetyltransferase